MSLLLLFLWLSFKQDHINYRIQFNSLVLSNDSLNSAIQGECPVKHYLALGAELSSLEYTGIIHFEHNHTHTTYTCRSRKPKLKCNVGPNFTKHIASNMSNGLRRTKKNDCQFVHRLTRNRRHFGKSAVYRIVEVFTDTFLFSSALFRHDFYDLSEQFSPQLGYLLGFLVGIVIVHVPHPFYDG